MLSGLLIGAGSSGWVHSCHDAGVKVPLGERVLDLVHLGGACHVLVDATARSLLRRNAKVLEEQGLRIREERKIASARFEYRYHVYAPQYGEQIQELLKSLPKGLKHEADKPRIEVDMKARGVEVYSPVHDFEEEGKGVISGARIDLVIEARRVLDEHPLVAAEPVELTPA